MSNKELIKDYHEQIAYLLDQYYEDKNNGIHDQGYFEDIRYYFDAIDEILVTNTHEVCPICKGKLSCIPCTKELCTPLKL